MRDKRHKVRINLVDQDDVNNNVIESMVENFPKKLFNKLFGKKRRVLIIAPSDSVTGIEIYESVGEKIGSSNNS
jgi:hypothetical protein